MKHGIEFGSQRFLCKDCHKTFTALTGTQFHRLRGKEKILDNATCIVNGLLVRKTAVRLGISVQKTFHWRHKFLGFLNQQEPGALMDVVEADETVFPVSYKGQRKNRRVSPRSVVARPRMVEGPRRSLWSSPFSMGRKSNSTKCFHEVPPSPWPKHCGRRWGLTQCSARTALQPGAVAKELNAESGSFISSYHGKGGDGVWRVQSVNRYDASLKNWMYASVVSPRSIWPII